METAVKCKKCGRLLKNPLSIAMGMGLKCAGISSTKGKKFHATSKHGLGGFHHAMDTGRSQTPVTISHTPKKKLSKKEQARRQCEERRRLFEERRSFLLGTLVGSKAPLVYEPVGEKDWKDSFSGRMMSQEQLHAYLMRYQFI